jgi:DNA polymerase-3 subunit delta
VIYLLHGPDDYRVRVAAREIGDRLHAADDMLDSNTTVLVGATVTPGELMAHVTAMPFLASHRLVVVEGLLGAIGAVRGGRRKKSDDDPLEPWRQLAARLADPATMPETTTLVFIEGELKPPKKAPNPALAIFASIATTREFGTLDKSELPEWISVAAERKGARLSGRAVAALAQLIGPDLWMLDREIDKLSAYADGEEVGPDMVADVVSAAHDTKIWDLTDALVAGNEKKALATMRRLIDEGDPPTQMAYMIVRAYRELIIIKDMRERGARQDEIVKASGVQNWKYAQISGLAARYSWPVLRAAYARLLDADLSVKRGLRDDETSLQLLIHELCTLAPAPAPAGRRSSYSR